MTTNEELANPDEYQALFRQHFNPEVFRSNMLIGSLFITTFEMLKASIVNQVRAFYYCEEDTEDALGRQHYKEQVLSLHKKENILTASVEWLLQASAIDAEDVDVFYELRETRNALVHEFPRMQDFQQPLDTAKSLIRLAQLLKKIDVWWFWNLSVELMPPDERPEESTEVFSGRQVMLRIMVDMVLEGTSGTEGD